MAVDIRPMTLDDVEAAARIQIAAFDDWDRRHGEDVVPTSEVQWQRTVRRLTHFLTHDPHGSFAAVEDDQLVGSGLAMRRDDLWGLSLLVVDPAEQSSGTGRRLLDATLTYAASCERAVILSSSDPRAMRSYATSGFDLHAQVKAKGEVRRDLLPSPDPRVNETDSADGELLDQLGKEVRGAAYGPDIELLGFSAVQFVIDDVNGRGSIFVRESGVVLQLLATDEATATALLWRGLAHCADIGRPADVEYLNSRQQWAIRVALAARLELAHAGPVLWRGDSPPPCYLPSGAYF